MPCFYCGKRISVVRSLNDSDFCSDEHRRRYSDLTRTALGRLSESDSPAKGKQPELAHSFAGTAAEADPAPETCDAPPDSTVQEPAWTPDEETPQTEPVADIAPSWRLFEEPEIQPEPVATIEPAWTFIEEEAQPERVAEPIFRPAAHLQTAEAAYAPGPSRDPSLPKQAGLQRLRSPRPEPGRVRAIRVPASVPFLPFGLAMVPVIYDSLRAAPPVCRSRAIVSTYAPPVAVTSYPLAMFPFRPNAAVVPTPAALHTTMRESGFIRPPALGIAGGWPSALSEAAKFKAPRLVAPLSPIHRSACSLRAMALGRDAAPLPKTGAAIPEPAGPASFSGAVQMQNIASIFGSGHTTELAVACADSAAFPLAQRSGDGQTKMDAAFFPPAELTLPQFLVASERGFAAAQLASVEMILPIGDARGEAIAAVVELAIPFQLVLPEAPTQPQPKRVAAARYLDAAQPFFYPPVAAKQTGFSEEPFEFATHLPEIQVPHSRPGTLKPSYIPRDPFCAQGVMNSVCAEVQVAAADKIELPVFSAARLSASKELPREAPFRRAPVPPAGRMEIVESPYADYPRVPQLIKHAPVLSALPALIEQARLIPVERPEARRGRKPIRMLAYVPNNTAIEWPRPIAFESLGWLSEAAAVSRRIEPLQCATYLLEGMVNVWPNGGDVCISSSALQISSHGAKLIDELTPLQLVPSALGAPVTSKLVHELVAMPIELSPLPRMPERADLPTPGLAEIMPLVVDITEATMPAAWSVTVAMQPASLASPHCSAPLGSYALVGEETGEVEGSENESETARHTQLFGT